MIDDLQKEVKTLMDTVPQIYKKLVSNEEYKEIYLKIMKFTSFMDKIDFDYNINTRIFFIMKGWGDFPKCSNPKCSNKVIHKRNITAMNYEYAYPLYCCDNCRYGRDEIQERNERTRLLHEKYNSRTDAQCLIELKEIAKKHPLYVQKALMPSPYNNRLIEYLFDKTQHLDNCAFEPTLSTRLFWVVNGLKDFPKCKCCGKPMNDKNIHSFISGYPTFCSVKCELNADKKDRDEFYNSMSEYDIKQLMSKDECELFDDLKYCLENHREYAKQIFRPGEKYHYLYRYIMDSTSFLDDWYTLKTRVFYILHGWREEQRCKECGNIIRKNMRSIYEKFPDYCSIKCSKPEAVKHTMETFYRKYGVRCISPINLPGVAEKSAKIRKMNFIAKKQKEYEEYQKLLQPYQRDDAEYWSLSKEQKELFRNELKELVTNKSIGYVKSIVSEGGEKHYLHKLIIQATSPLLSDPFYTFSTKVWFVLNEQIKFPRCIECGKRLDHKNLNMWSRGFPRFCSPRCSTINEETVAKMESTCMELYGVDKAMKNEDIKNYSKQQLIKKYGTTNTFSIPEIREKYFSTNLERYGVKYSSQSPEIQEKIKRTNLEKFKCACCLGNKDIREKVKQTMIKKFCCENPQQNEDIKRRTRMTNMKRYGAENPMQSHNIFLKNIKKYNYKGIIFHSSWELAYYIWLNDNNIEFEYQPDVYFEYKDGTTVHRYFPDFRIENRIVEIKGDQFFDKEGKMINPYSKEKDNKYESKYKCMVDNDVLIMRGIDIQPYLKYVYNKYGRDYLRNFKEN